MSAFYRFVVGFAFGIGIAEYAVDGARWGLGLAVWALFVVVCLIGDDVLKAVRGRDF